MLPAMRTASLATKAFWALALIAALGTTYALWTLNRPLHPGSEPYLVKPGTGLYVLAHELSRRSVIVDTRTFTLLGRAILLNRNIKAGEYLFRDGISARGILEQLAAG